MGRGTDDRRALDRRQMIAGSGTLVASCTSIRESPAARRTWDLDALLEAHAGVMPEKAGAGANHYPMAGEALEALGFPESIGEDWRARARGYARPIPRVATVTDWKEALGDYGRYGDWLDLFRAECARQPWRAVVAQWVPRLAPGASAAVFHGLIRTAHAVRALRQAENGARQDELAVALAYWAARYCPLEAAAAGPGLWKPLAELDHPWLAEREDVPFDEVHARLARAPIAPPVSTAEVEGDVPLALAALVREAASAFLEMLVLEQHRIWLLHTVTGPAAASLIVPDLEEEGARMLAAYVRQAVMALFTAFGAPHTPLTHLRGHTAGWPEFTRRAAESRSVHTIKLIEVLYRFRATDEALCRSVAAQWFEWT
jgi:hypothetical protein